MGTAPALIHPMTSEFADYLRDESRTTGTADTISFPRSEADVAGILRSLHPAGTPVTVQGARTGLAAAAVPGGGHVLNLSRMDRVLSLREQDGRFFVTAQPGVVLLNLRKMIASRRFETAGWDEQSLAALEALKDAPEQFFPTDPTETTASIGGMTACNASGARSYLYGPMRRHVTALRGVLADGRVCSLRRGQCFADGLRFRLPLADGSFVEGSLPDYHMPQCKNASGYFIAPGMDLLDLLIGSDGTLAVVTAVELALMPLPNVIWGTTCFFPSEQSAAQFTEKVRAEMKNIAALEYFDARAMDILREQRAVGGVFARLPDPGGMGAAAIYAELHCASEAEALDGLRTLAALSTAVGGDPGRSWVARTELDRETLTFFRHAVPESVNSLIDKRRQTVPGITKLGSDMSVPDGRLLDVMELYRQTLAEGGFEYATWGHIGDNHLHVNILPRDMAEHARGKELFLRWAREVTAMGGAVSAEHGVGKLKAPFLTVMAGEAAVDGMRRLKRAFDPLWQLGRGNLFSEEDGK